MTSDETTNPVLELGKRRALLIEETERVQEGLIHAVREAVRSGQPKVYVAGDAKVTRRTLDRWLAE